MGKKKTQPDTFDYRWVLLAPPAAPGLGSRPLIGRNSHGDLGIFVFRCRAEAEEWQAQAGPEARLGIPCRGTRSQLRALLEEGMNRFGVNALFQMVRRGGEFVRETIAFYCPDDPPPAPDTEDLPPVLREWPSAPDGQNRFGLPTR